MGEAGALRVYCDIHSWTFREFAAAVADVDVVDDGMEGIEIRRTNENVLLIRR